MASDLEIGRVVAVDTAQVTVELNKDLKSLTRATYDSVHEVARINSYLIIPVGARRLVAMVTRVQLTEDAELSSERTVVTLPTARRTTRATLIGTIDGTKFDQGVSLFPTLDSPVLLMTPEDQRAIFHPISSSGGEVDRPEAPGCCIRIGESAVFDECEIRLDPDVLFGKHVAVLGSTGSGKSCTIASLLQSVLGRRDVRRSHIIVLDTNGEYANALAGVGGSNAAAGSGCLYIPSDSSEAAKRLVVPYWFMNADDFTRLFQASKGVQRPVLLEALRLARNDGAERGPLVALRDELVHEFNRMWALTGSDEKKSKDLRDLAVGLLARMEEANVEAGWRALASTDASLKKKAFVDAVKAVKSEAERHIDEGKYPKVLPADARQRIREALDPPFGRLTEGVLGGPAGVGGTGISADSPAYFDKRRFRNRHIEQVLRREESGGARARDYAGTMLLRMDRLLEDSRFEFLFGSVAGSLPKAKGTLAAFIRDLLGLPSAEAANAHSTVCEAPEKSLPFYDRQRSGSPGHRVVVVDLSLLAAEALENVTALIGRVVLEFLQRLGEYGGADARGSLPVVLVLEEAQNYIREGREQGEESVSRYVFERIAREGRKFGLGLVVASQRPSELSRTVLSQCGTFIVHRLQNPEDMKYFEQIVPGIFKPLLQQVPALAPRMALVLGQGVRAPALVRIREANPLPRSRDPKFYSYWAAGGGRKFPVEEVCERWERGESGRVAGGAAP